ncbi:MAG: hypothetical protein JRI23_16360, partial [Deltaproteobacteria bacterium]|nr:hypothetical protein [Deltaproteobacteria bacterium]MBW2533345.1 hypothetical protein [Deltaproteobacteria bacterium]
MGASGLRLGWLLPLVVLAVGGCSSEDEELFGTGTRTSDGGRAGDGGAGGAGGTPLPDGVLGVPNVDDDDEDGQADWLQAPFEADDDLASWSLPPERLADLGGLDSIELALAGDVDGVRLWKDDTIVLGVGSEAEPIVEHVLRADDSGAELVVEFGDFHRQATLTVVALDGANAELDRFDVALLSAQLVIQHHLQATERVYGVRTGSNDAMVSGLASAAGSSFVAIESYDPWIQDELQWAAATAPAMRLDVAMDSIRDRELDSFVKSLQAPDVQPITWGPAGAATTEDKFGNLEVTPPHTAGGTDYGLGRIYYGAKGTLGPNQELTAFLAEQSVQAPFALDTSWLCIGHVDEFVTFVPAPSSAKGFVVLFADVDAGYEVLEAMEPSTALPRYAATHGYGSVGAIVADAALRTLNEQVQIDHLDPLRAQLMAELDLAETDLVRVPALFERWGYCPYGSEPIEVVALVPALVNLAVVTLPDEPVTLLVPDPFLRPSGAAQSTDPLVQAFTSLMPAGVEVVFLDDWFSYHAGGGEVHCGTSVARTPAGHGFVQTRRPMPPSSRGVPARREPAVVAGLPAPIPTRAGTLRFVDPSLWGSTEARDRLLGALDRAHSTAVRAAIVEALPRTATGWAPALVAHLEREPDPALRKLV